ncbi:hypothetical protein [Sphingomonas sp. Mn802worker]|uniref:hypothetical protein n=1 Tax=Sphingomonas sp. Mn802worker TaxID=629773 RepID=UPI0012E9C0E3|nr:hypothetical protein [Sphingomonas sp. Mn802worker]
MPHRSNRLLPLLCAALVPLAGCAVPEGPYPSLAPRPVEKLGFAEPAPPAPAPVRPDPALDARLADNARERAAAVAAFDIGASRAERLARAARGAKAGSEPWLDAQTALAELDTLRARHQDALSVLEDMASMRAQALEPAYPALEAALKTARDTSTAQTRRIDAIAGSLASA